MALICAHCGSADMQALADKHHCLICGKYTTPDGKKAK